MTSSRSSRISPAAVRLEIDTSNHAYSATNVSLKKLLESAYDIKEDLISGVSRPVASARFDIEAKIVEPDPDTLRKLSARQQGAMLLPFLVERFQLKAHTETKTPPVYELIVIKGGPKFKQSASDSIGNRGTSIHNRELTAHDIPMTSFARTLESQLHRTVIDKTGLTGCYDFTLRWSLVMAPTRKPTLPRPSLPPCRNSSNSNSNRQKVQ
jgi:uncharacterized protein (TIGR03435 family)